MGKTLGKYEHVEDLYIDVVYNMFMEEVKKGNGYPDTKHIFEYAEKFTYECMYENYKRIYGEYSANFIKVMAESMNRTMECYYNTLISENGKYVVALEGQEAEKNENGIYRVFDYKHQAEEFARRHNNNELKYKVIDLWSYVHDYARELYFEHYKK